MHPLVRAMLEEEGDLFGACTEELKCRWPAVMCGESSWTNAVQQLAVKLQQNLEVRALFLCLTCCTVLSAYQKLFG